jgi:hypothetical protein
MHTQCQHEEQNADGNALQQRMFGATKSASDKTGNACNRSDRESRSRRQSAGFSFHAGHCTTGAKKTPVAPGVAADVEGGG